MNKMMLTVALAGFLVAAPSFADTSSSSQQQSPNFTRGACTGSTTDCLKQAGSDTVGGFKKAGEATVNVGKSATNTVVGAAKDTGDAITKPFTGNSSSSSNAQTQQQSGSNQ